MKKLLFVLLVSFVSYLSYSQTGKDDKMPITTSSKSALAYYNEAMKCLNDIAFQKALDLFSLSLKEDPQFFMANYELSSFYLWFGPPEKFKEYADGAINCKSKISPAEELLKSAIVKLKEKQNADVTDLGRKLVEMYPKDPNSYSNLVYFQIYKGDSLGVIETLNKALKIAEDKAPFYNLLGYSYMRLKENDKAEVAFNQYIELAPKNPNVYDSKGDFYMNIKDYDKAFETYMKAYALDTAWGYNKAQQAKKLSEDKNVLR